MTGSSLLPCAMLSLALLFQGKRVVFPGARLPQVLREIHAVFL